MATANEILADEAIRHAIDLLRYENGVVERMIALLRGMDRDLVARILAALEDLPADSFTVQRLDTLLRSVRELNVAAHERLGKALEVELLELTRYESGYQESLFRETIPEPILANITVATVSAERVYAAAMAQPFQGRLLREWVKTVEQTTYLRVRDVLRMGYAESQTINEMVRRVRGTRSLNYADGVLSNVRRRQVEAVVRTATSHFAGFAQDRFYEANADIVGEVQWVSTLDTRTSEMCRIRDGLRYQNTDEHKPVGHRVPWLSGPGRLHWNCRSRQKALLKTWRELGIESDQLSATTRASMDGQVPAQTTYAEWLKRQSAARQDDILGATRGKLMREGGLTMDRFYNDKGRWLTLDELRKRDAEAFRRAGV